MQKIQNFCSSLKITCTILYYNNIKYDKIQNAARKKILLLFIYFYTARLLIISNITITCSTIYNMIMDYVEECYCIYTLKGVVLNIKQVI